MAALRAAQEIRISIERLAVGDEFMVRPGEEIVADGAVGDGFSTIDESMLTGESVPVEVSVGLAVPGGRSMPPGQS